MRSAGAHRSGRLSRHPLPSSDISSFRRARLLLFASIIRSSSSEPRSTHLLAAEAAGVAKPTLLAEAIWASIQSKMHMLDAYTRLRNPKYNDGHWGIASDHGRFKYGTAKTSFIFEQLMKAQAAGRLPRYPVTCEAGFNAGHSAILFLDAVPTGRHFEFSFGQASVNPYEPQNAAMFAAVYKQRFTYTWGDTNQTLREFAKNESNKCDVIFVDGAKGIDGRKNDLLLFREASKPGALVFGDEANTPECMSGEVDRSHPKCAMVNFNTEWAYNDLVRSGFLKYEGCSKEKKIGAPRDLVCLWTFAQ